MYDRSTTPVQDHLARLTIDLPIDPVTAKDTIDPVLSRLFIEAGRHVPSGTLELHGVYKLTTGDVATSLDALIAAMRFWSSRATNAERELRELRAERDTVRAYFGVQP